MTFSSPPGEGLGAVKCTSWKDILKTRCWSTDVTHGKPLVTVLVTRALRELLRKGVTRQRAKQSHERLKVWHWGLCIVYLYPHLRLYRTDISRAGIQKSKLTIKGMQGLGSGLLPVSGISCLIPTLFLSLFFLILLQHHSLRWVHCWAGPNSHKIWEIKKVLGWHHSINRHEFEQIPREWRTRKADMLQSMMLQKVGHDLVIEQQHEEVPPNMCYSCDASLTAQVLSPLPFLASMNT